MNTYFYRIDHDVLMSILRRVIAEEGLLSLLERIVRSETVKFGLALDDYDFAGERLPGVGMPIGNLTSQMFANLYLNELDQYAKHRLKIRYYVRYMDDIIVLHHDKKTLWGYKDSIERFLNDYLKLSLNDKTCVRTINQGVEFCGYWIWPTHIKIKKKTALKMKRRLKYLQKQYRKGLIDFTKFNASLQSYLGIMKHCNSYRLRTKLLRSIRLKRGD